jgi:hypothetical protein
MGQQQQPPVDYDQLAAAIQGTSQAGTVDYDALAAAIDPDFRTTNAIDADGQNVIAGSDWTDALPMVGGMAGSLVGGSKLLSPVGIALAGVGGAAGEAFKQVADSVRGDFSDVPETAGGRLRKIGSEGLRQAGWEGAGRVVSRIVQPVAKTIYGLAMRPSKGLMREAGGGKLVKGAKAIINQGYADNVMPSGIGMDRAGRLLGESADEATAIAAQSPATVSTKRVMQRATDDQALQSADELIGAGITPKTDQIATQIGNVIDSNPDMLPMKQLLDIRRRSDQVAKPAFDAAKIPGGQRVAPGSEASISRSIADASRQTLDDVLGDGFKAVNRRTLLRSAVKSAVDDAAARPNQLANLLAGGVGVSSVASSGDPLEAIKHAALMRALASPTLAGALSLGIGKAPYSQLFRASDAATREPTSQQQLLHDQFK